MLKKLTQSETLAEQAYREIKQAIIEGRFSPGEHLPEEAIASMLGISRTPLKKAIEKLSYEGLVDLRSGKIARVAEYTPNDIENFLQLRVLLEPFNVEQIVRIPISEEKMSELVELVEEQKKAIEDNDLYQFIQLDAEFHLSLAKLNSNQKLQQFIEQLNNNLHRRYLILSKTLEYGSKTAYEEHVSILKALQKGNPEEAGRAMKTHIQNVENRIRGYQASSLH
ncbi:GntR family transcriptional regulator [Fictibacillus sp. KU28468]|uniref:GntR family transcriptional regulator n=1 Tax=Fictibacillus sp. KU28468 TaxID=2991053 RepID=UPI00223DAB72|nr:GntR family transcriptional regulator [Fictibacillus sp. KU28468]UZJ80543.1 GntR family transcriptional regulator [Fictibacillus sp. KU28468]